MKNILEKSKKIINDSNSILKYQKLNCIYDKKIDFDNSNRYLLYKNNLFSGLRLRLMNYDYINYVSYFQISGKSIVLLILLSKFTASIYVYLLIYKAITLKFDKDIDLLNIDRIYLNKDGRTLTIYEFRDLTYNIDIKQLTIKENNKEKDSITLGLLKNEKLIFKNGDIYNHELFTAVLNNCYIINEDTIQFNLLNEEVEAIKKDDNENRNEFYI